MAAPGAASANSKYASIVIDANTGKVLQETSADARIYPASLTKMMTLYVLFEELDAGVKPWVKPDIENRIREGSIPALWRHRVVEIGARDVLVESLESGERR